MPNLEQEIGSWDSVLLETLTEDNFISNLSQRFKRDHIYTYIGTFLISINPYKPLSIYTPDLISTYAKKSLFQLPPHIYALTNAAYKCLQDHNEDQIIILSGESGSGKTETSRMIVHFLTKISELHKTCNEHETSTIQHHHQPGILRQRSVNSITNKRDSGCFRVSSNPNSRTSTPKHCYSAEKSSCMSKTSFDNISGQFGSLKRCSHEKTVEFDFSRHKSTENLSTNTVGGALTSSLTLSNKQLCQKHQHSVVSTSSTTSSGSSSSIICPKHHHHHQQQQMITTSNNNPLIQSKTILNNDQQFVHKANCELNHITNQHCNKNFIKSASGNSVCNIDLCSNLLQQQSQLQQQQQQQISTSTKSILIDANKKSVSNCNNISSNINSNSNNNNNNNNKLATNCDFHLNKQQQRVNNNNTTSCCEHCSNFIKYNNKLTTTFNDNKKCSCNDTIIQNKIIIKPSTSTATTGGATTIINHNNKLPHQLSTTTIPTPLLSSSSLASQSTTITNKNKQLLRELSLPNTKSNSYSNTTNYNSLKLIKNNNNKKKSVIDNNIMIINHNNSNNINSKIVEDCNDNMIKIRERVAQADIFLEAIGNATTMKNDNSSRFGKFFDIEFDFKGDPIGGHITHYMLEKSRITSAHTGERNFHIFYQLLSGADIQFLKQLKLQRNIDKYEILKHGVTSDDDKNNFLYTKKSLEILGLTNDEILSIFKIIAVVIKLGNIVFIPTTDIDGTENCEIANEYELHEIAQLLNLDEKILINCLTRADTNWSQLESGAELDAINASRVKNSLCRTLYGRLFTWIVNRINDALKINQYSRGRSLGILDFYGFEILDNNNSFEQLGINYCNERLHQSFLQNVLKYQQDLYIREGLEWNRIDFFDNENICELIDKTNYGILSLLDEPKVSCDETFVTRLQQCCSGNPNFLSQDITIPPKCFQIRHYAGPVIYCVKGFREKNYDILPKNITYGLYQSKLKILQSLFPEGNPKRLSRKPTSSSTNLRITLQTLLTIINNRKCNYVFCLKPNEVKKSRLFELALIQHQVRYMSLMPLVNLWRTGHCYNITHQKFFNRYKLLTSLTWPYFNKGSLIEGVALIIRSLRLPSAEFTIGIKRVFIRSPRTINELEEYRKARLDNLAILIQKQFRCYSKRKLYLKMKQSQIIISNAWRTWRECRFGIPYKGRRHLFCLYNAAKEEYRIMKYRKQVEWSVGVIQRSYIQFKRRQYLLTLTLRFTPDVMSPLCMEWPMAPRFLAETSQLLRNIHHRWRCYRYRKSFDQTSRNRMREKVTASIIFKDRKASYAKSVSHPFIGDYVRLRQNIQWKKISLENNDQYVVFADIINKITRSSGKFVPILLVLSTSSMLLLDQRTLQIKYRVPAAEIYRLSLSPYIDDIAVFHVKAEASNAIQLTNSDNNTGCLFQSELGRKKGDFVFQTGHVIEIVTKLFLVVQNATSKPPEIHISTEFEANFNQQTVVLTFKCGANNSCGNVGATSNALEMLHNLPKVNRKGNRMEIII